LEEEDRRRSIGVVARAEAKERYSWDRIAQRLVEIYQEVAGRTRSMAEAS
jgi:glycosyltransferase involved in cell wall biosynthesis